MNQTLRSRILEVVQGDLGCPIYCTACNATVDEILKIISDEIPEKGLANHALQSDLDRAFSKGFNSAIDQMKEKLK